MTFTTSTSNIADIIDRVAADPSKAADLKAEVERLARAGFATTPYRTPFRGRETVRVESDEDIFDNMPV